MVWNRARVIGIVDTRCHPYDVDFSHIITDYWHKNLPKQVGTVGSLECKFCFQALCL
jgi:hypothetical protein